MKMMKTMYRFQCRSRRASGMLGVSSSSPLVTIGTSRWPTQLLFLLLRLTQSCSPPTIPRPFQGPLISSYTLTDPELLQKLARDPRTCSLQISMATDDHSLPPTVRCQNRSKRRQSSSLSTASEIDPIPPLCTPKTPSDEAYA